MQRSDLQAVLESKSPEFFTRLPDGLSTGIKHILERIVHARELLEFFDQHGDTRNWKFIDAVFAFLGVSYTVRDEDLKKIPAHGRLICVANHATGPLDGLFLLHLLGRVRQDVKIVLTDLLAGLDNLNDLFLLYDQYTPRLQKTNISAIRRAIVDEQAVIFFPAGEVTKLSRRGIRENTWQPGALSLARKYHAPLLPVRIQARNSWFYYVVALLHTNASTLLLSHEMFQKRSQRIPLTVGDLLPVPQGDIREYTAYLRKHVQSLGHSATGDSRIMSK